MIITVPPELCVATLDWQLDRFDRRFEGLSGQFQTESYPAARWRCTVTLPPMKPLRAGAVEAFLIRVSDLGNRFELGRDDRPLMGAGGGTPVVYGAGQTGRSIMTDGWPAGALILRAGDMIQLGPNRLHMVTADVYSSPGGILLDEEGDPILTEDSPGQQIELEGNGRASIPIEPALQSSPADGQAIVTGVNAKAVFMLDSQFGVTSIPGIISGIAFSAVQDIASTLTSAPPPPPPPAELLTAFSLEETNNSLLPDSGFSGFEVPEDVTPPTFATQYETDTGNPWIGEGPLVFSPSEYRNVYHVGGWTIDIVEYVFVLKAWNGGIVSASSVATGIAVIDSTVVTGGDTVTVTATLTHIESGEYVDSSIAVTANFAGGPQVVTLYNKTGYFIT